MMSAHIDSNDANAEILEIRKQSVWMRARQKKTLHLFRKNTSLHFFVKLKNVMSVLSSKQNKYNIILE